MSSDSATAAAAPVNALVQDFNTGYRGRLSDSLSSARLRLNRPRLTRTMAELSARAATDRKLPTVSRDTD